jgi:hypothetical protein
MVTGSVGSGCSNCNAIANSIYRESGHATIRGRSTGSGRLLNEAAYLLLRGGGAELRAG